MSAPPSIPPRPTRAQNNSASAAQLDAPKVPPRPNRGINRSVSPAGDRYAPSPLNDPTYLHGPPPKESSRLSTELPSRPPSVSLPSLGEEGNEYASFEDLSKTLTNESQGQAYGSPQQTKAIAGDLPLHAPKASVPASTAKNRIQTVTRTDSSQAEAAGFGKLAPDDKTSTSGSKTGRSGSSIGSRPSSIYNDKDEHGIPEIGVQVPMFRNAGDVQAPSPAPFSQQSAGGPSSQHKSGGRHHGRTKSGREIFHGPPGSYGLHGHGKISQDDFEQKWYEKHPEDLKREKAGEYGPHIQENRKDYHWRSETLEQLVHAPGGIGLGTLRTFIKILHVDPVPLTCYVGTSREAVSTPDEQIGYLASEQYASRYTSPKPQSSGRPASIKASTHTDSPLRQEAQPAGEDQLDDDGRVIHIDPPAHRGSKIHGGGYDPPTENLGPEGGNTAEQGGWVTEHGYGTPILASDELKKHPDAEWRQPAVSPELERRGDEYAVSEDGSKIRSHSRSSSRNNNIQAQRAITSPQFERGGTPLESHKEYEPLFPEDEETNKKPKTQVDKIKRPSVARHHFPSQDVWEDTPGSLQLQTTVETPEPVEDTETLGSAVSAGKVFEKPEAEEFRKEDITNEDKQSFLPEHTRRFAAQNKILGKVRDDHSSRPGLQQRFPSQDIWEDAPEHGHLETTVSTPQTEDTNEYADDSPVAEKPSIPARPNVPARPKPQIPARPKPATTARGEDTNAEVQATENEPPQAKAKPPVPARPGGSKIAALQAGFLKDLNSKLGIGPQAPKVKEQEPDKEEEPAAPLQDARKGRAKGPQRRKPAASPAPAATVTAEVAVPRQNLTLGSVTVVWSFGEDGALTVPAATLAAQLHSKLYSSNKAGGAAVETADTPLSKTTSTSAELAEVPQDDTISKELPVVAPSVTKDADELLETKSKSADETLLITTKANETVSSQDELNEEPLVTENAPGSVDAVGAFTGKEAGDDDGTSGGISLEGKPTTVEGPGKKAEQHQHPESE